MKKLTKLTALLTAAVLAVPSTAVSADTEHTAHTETDMKDLWETVIYLISDNQLRVFPSIEDDVINLTVYGHHCSEETVRVVETFIKENGIDPSLIKITAKTPDPAVEKYADMINEFIEEMGLHAHAEVYTNTLYEVTVEIDNWREQRSLTDMIRAYMKDNGIDDRAVTFLARERIDENGVMRGDIDEDRLLTFGDLSMLRELFDEYPDDTLPVAADFNGDGRTNSDDVTELENYLKTIDSIDPYPSVRHMYGYTRSGFSELSLSGSKAVCKSLICGYDTVTKIIVEQTLQKKDTNGKWKNVKTWKKTVNDYKAAVKNSISKLPKGYYRLKTKSVVYSGKNNETVEKYSKHYALGISPYTGDANSDGKVSVRDCAYIAKILAVGKSKNLPVKADYNLDGKRNVRDAAALACSLAGK